MARGASADGAGDEARKGNADAAARGWIWTVFVTSSSANSLLAGLGVAGGGLAFAGASRCGAGSDGNVELSSGFSERAAAILSLLFANHDAGRSGRASSIKEAFARAKGS